MNEELTLEEMIDRGVERLLNGEPLERVLAAHSDRAAELRPALESAASLLSTPTMESALEPRVAAMRRMLDQVEAAAHGEEAVAGTMPRFLDAFRSRPIAFQGVAIAAAAVLFGGLAIGASAAAGSTPDPVRNFFGISGSGVIRVELTGVIVSVDTTNATLVVDANGDLRTVIITQRTELSGKGNSDDLAVLAPGLRVEIEGTLQPDNSIIAREIDVEDDDGAAEPSATSEAPAAPTQGAAAPDDDPDDDERDDDDDDDIGHDDDGEAGRDDDGDSRGDDDDDDDDGDNHEDDGRSGPPHDDDRRGHPSGGDDDDDGAGRSGGSGDGDDGGDDD